MQCLLLPTTTPIHTHTHTHFNTGQSATRAAERQLRFRCCWFSVTLASEREWEWVRRTNVQTWAQSDSNWKATKLSCGLWAMRSTKTDGSAANVVVVEEKAKMEWRESAANDVRCRLGKGKWRQCVTWRKCALEAGCGAWWVLWWISLPVCSRALWSGEFAFAAPTATCCCCCSLPLGFNWTCNVQRATATDSECPPKNSSAAADARVPQFSFIVDWALAYH